MSLQEITKMHKNDAFDWTVTIKYFRAKIDNYKENNIDKT